MSAPLREAIAKMLQALNAQVVATRIDAFTEALDEAGGCHDCAVIACRKLTAYMHRRPVPRDLLEETRELMDKAAHWSHVSDRAALPGDAQRWWATEAPAIVKREWPELSSEQAQRIAATMRAFGFVRPTEDDIRVELGYVDAYGPTTERTWWIREVGA